MGVTPAPAKALPTESLAVGATGEVELAVAVPLSGVVVSMEEPTDERPAGAIDTRFSLEVFFV